MDWLKEAIETYSSRIKSPIFGSIITVFIALNWKPILYLLFSGESLITKFSYWNLKTDLHSTLTIPILLGLLIAFITPWISFAGSWLASKPTNRLNHLKEASNHEKIFSRIQFENRREGLIAEIKSHITKQAQADSELSKIDDDQIKEAAQKKIDTKITSIQNPKVEIIGGASYTQEITGREKRETNRLLEEIKRYRQLRTDSQADGDIESAEKFDIKLKELRAKLLSIEI